MKNKVIIVPFLFLMASSSCEKTEVKENCYTGKIIQNSCGGVIIQILDPLNVGESWSDFFVTPSITYENCVLAPSILHSNSAEQSEIYFNFSLVDKFESGYFCDIGGLPKTKIKITEMFDTKCDDKH